MVLHMTGEEVKDLGREISVIEAGVLELELTLDKVSSKLGRGGAIRDPRRPAIRVGRYTLDDIAGAVMKSLSGVAVPLQRALFRAWLRRAAMGGDRARPGMGGMNVELLALVLKFVQGSGGDVLLAGCACKSLRAAALSLAGGITARGARCIPYGFVVGATKVTGIRVLAPKTGLFTFNEPPLDHGASGLTSRLTSLGLIGCRLSRDHVLEATRGLWRLKELDLQGNCLDWGVARQGTDASLAVGLASLTLLEVLGLSSCNIGSNSGAELLKVVADGLPHLLELDLSGNPLVGLKWDPAVAARLATTRLRVLNLGYVGILTEAAIQIYDSLGQATALTSLSMRGNGLIEVGARALACIGRSRGGAHSRLRTLDLASNAIFESILGSRGFFSAMRATAWSVTEIDISGNVIGSQGDLQEIAAGIQHVTGLRALGLSAVRPARNPPIFFFSSLLEWPAGAWTLRELDLSNNRITAGEAAGFGRWATRLVELRVLKLSFNELGRWPDGQVGIGAPQFMSQWMPLLTELRTLKINGNRDYMKYNGAAPLGFLAALTRLTELDLDSIGIEAGNARHVGDALAGLAGTLVRLDMGNSALGVEGIAELGLTRLTRLRDLDLRCCSLHLEPHAMGLHDLARSLLPCTLRSLCLWQPSEGWLSAGLERVAVRDMALECALTHRHGAWQ